MLQTALNQQPLVTLMMIYSNETGHRLLAWGEKCSWGDFTLSLHRPLGLGENNPHLSNGKVWIEPLDSPPAHTLPSPGQDEQEAPEELHSRRWGLLCRWSGRAESSPWDAAPSPWCSGITWTFISSSLIWSSFSLMSIVNFLHSVSSSRMRFRKVSVHSPLQGNSTGEGGEIRVRLSLLSCLQHGN